MLQNNRITELDTLKSNSTLNQLDALLALRGLACLMVVIIHCSPPRESITYHENDLSWLLFSNGGVAVWIFFCLSGYLMGKAFYTKHYRADVSGIVNFWRNRALRIFPLYYFAVLILSLFVYPDIMRMYNWGYLVRISTFTYNHSIGSPPIDFDAVFWSLSTEIQFYVIVPFIYTYLKPRLVKKRQIFTAASLIFIVVFILRLAIKIYCSYFDSNTLSIYCIPSLSSRVTWIIRACRKGSKNIYNTLHFATIDSYSYIFLHFCI